ncbi:uncharacterized protein LOC105704406 isoform X2 [Orussus abietinus]|nr:uncharacterized protein LOC105704406 isoform X2 [Orussus abietinus]XP_012289031.1 uncharacterized protein LOC105704406 isoform X2 [Orussus abietinus]
MLEEDLGQEPTILLRDMSFDVLKAMVEFMYCGETTLSHEYLKPLLEAATIFKVRELAYIISTLMGSQDEDEVKNCGESIDCSEHAETLKLANEFNDCDDSIQLNVSKENEISTFKLNENENLDSGEELPSDNFAINENEGQEVEHMLYEESGFVQADVSTTKNFTLSNSLEVKKDNIRKNLNSKYDDYAEKFDDEFEEKSIKCQQENVEKSVFPNNAEKCLKVYTHKKRKWMDMAKNRLIQSDRCLPQASVTDCIDLDNPCNEDVLITVSTSIDLNDTEYTLNFSTENAIPRMGRTSNDPHLSFSDDKVDNEKIRTNVELGNESNRVLSRCKEIRSSEQVDTESYDDLKASLPVLRRSERLNQYEYEEPVSNKLSLGRINTKFMVSKKNTNITEPLDESKHNVKEQCIINKSVTTSQSPKKNFTYSRSLRNASKSTTKSNAKSRFSLTRSNKEEHKPKSSNKFKCEKSEKTEYVINDSIACPATLNVVSSINRALWGDMADVLENGENVFDWSEHSNSKEIPFAVGLLPLRAALERLQAIPDYHPRKTRSSAAPCRQELNSFKRKHSPSKESCGKIKKHADGNAKENTSTVCHVKISTTSAQSMRNRKRFLAEHVEPPTLSSKQ